MTDSEAATGSHRGPRARFTQRMRRITPSEAFRWLAYLWVALLMMWPVPLHPTSTFLGHKDASYYMWLVWRMGRLITSGDIFTGNIPDVVIPYGASLVLMDGHLPLMMGALWNLVAGPVLAFNLTILTITLLNMWAGGRIGRLFSDHRGVWIVTGIAFAMAPAIVMRMFVHLPMYAAFPVALLMEQAIRIARDNHRPNPLVIGGLLFLAFLCSVYFFVFGAIAFVVFVLVASNNLKQFFRRCLAIGVAVLIVSVLLLPFAIPRLARDREEKAAGGDPVLIENSYRSSADVLSIVAQPLPSAIDLPGSARLRETFRVAAPHESTIFPGFLALIGGIGAALLLPIPLKRSVLMTPLTLWLLALGTSLKFDGNFMLTDAGGNAVPWLPYTLFFHIPGMGSLRAPNRASYALATALVVGLAASLGWLVTRFKLRWQRSLLFVIATALLATNLLIPVPESDIAVGAETKAALSEIAARDDRDDAALVVPADCGNETVPDVRLQILHEAPLVGCQFSSSALPLYSGMELYYQSEELAALRCVQNLLYTRPAPFHGDQRFSEDDASDLYEKFGVRYLIVDKELLARPICTRLRESLTILSQYDILADDSHWQIVDLQS